MRSDAKKRRSYLALLFSAGDLRRYVPPQTALFLDEDLKSVSQRVIVFL